MDIAYNPDNKMIYVTVTGLKYILLDNINELEQIINKNNKYVNILPGDSIILEFLLSKKVEVVTKEYMGKPFEQIRFRVKERNGDNQEKFFDVGKKSADLIKDKLKEGYRLLKIERKGSGKDTLYIPTPVSNDRE